MRQLGFAGLATSRKRTGALNPAASGGHGSMGFIKQIGVPGIPLDPLEKPLGRDHGLLNRLSLMSKIRRLAMLVSVAVTLLAPTNRLWAGEGNLPVVRLLTIPEASIAIMGKGADIQWEKPGYLIELLLEVGKRTGVKFEFDRVPWKRCLYMIKEGSADATFSASYKPERAKYAAYPMKDGKPDVSRAVRNYVYWLFRKKNSALTWDGSNLANLKGVIAAKRSDSIVGTLKTAGVDVAEVVTYTQTLRMLEMDRVDGAALVEHYGMQILKSNPEEFSNIVRDATPLIRKVGYLMFSKIFYRKNKELVERIWNSLAEMRNSGEIAKIRIRYIEVK